MNNLSFFFIVVPLIAVLFLGVNLIFAPNRPDESKVSAYECGFEIIHGQTRATFQIHFYVVAMLFLIFDLELILLFPVAITLLQVSTFGFSVSLIFFMVLTVGFILEIGSGAIALTQFEKPE